MFKVRRGSGEEIPLVQGKEQRLYFAGAAVKIPHVQGKRNPGLLPPEPLPLQQSAADLYLCSRHSNTALAVSVGSPGPVYTRLVKFEENSIWEREFPDQGSNRDHLHWELKVLATGPQPFKTVAVSPDTVTFSMTLSMPSGPNSSLLISHSIDSSVRHVL
ncbi:hypothetical protein MG293_001459 [Ovis ammon polii]|uniref:Uncharacterized protein n=1 Tax=Ovis ammon polii TaxID=230172 RepID=A0AAD4YI31_OVIAM|nr:hypothetical protein MG293_001459 [Ovis ammon polii]